MIVSPQLPPLHKRLHQLVTYYHSLPSCFGLKCTLSQCAPVVRETDKQLLLQYWARLLPKLWEIRSGNTVKWLGTVCEPSGQFPWRALHNRSQVGCRITIAHFQRRQILRPSNKVVYDLVPCSPTTSPPRCVCRLCHNSCRWHDEGLNDTSTLVFLDHLQHWRRTKLSVMWRYKLTVMDMSGNVGTGLLVKPEEGR